MLANDDPPPDSDGGVPTWVLAMAEPDVDEVLEPDEEVSELTGVERGRYRVLTQRSTYLFDLTAGTVAREPRTVNDQPWLLRSIEACRVGEVGCWTMMPHQHETVRIHHRLHFSTAIRRIERLH